MLLYVHKDHKDYSRGPHGQPRTETSTFTQLLNSAAVKKGLTALVMCSKNNKIMVDQNRRWANRRSRGVRRTAVGRNARKPHSKRTIPHRGDGCMLLNVLRYQLTY